ncbi:hypothetical protein PUN28_005952 [Cardiocondyla obscurior]|uniref:Uncharacterized protein n=1 Tax=Cardiocondyla obscurior TaxID=286306 RepID=A0AAW2G864_9HYME
MRKLFVLFCFALLSMTLVMACSRPGVRCATDDDCCGQFGCNPFNGICTGRPGMGPGGPWGPGGPVGAGIPRGPAY